MTARTLGPYRLEQVLGRGGFGAVYRAIHVPTGAVRAVKVLDGAADPEVLRRFRREAQALARVGPEVAIAVHEAGQEGATFWIALELAAGGTLADRLARGPLPRDEAVALAARLARALAACHAAGIVHRDLKPANVLFDEEGRARLADFGLVRDLAATSGLTASGTSPGTPRYMAPELFAGVAASPASDVWALGVVLHEMLSGARAFEGRVWSEVMANVAHGRRRPLADASVEAIVARALVLAPAARPGAAELARSLESLDEAPPARSRRAGWLLAPLALATLLARPLFFAASPSARPIDVGPTPTGSARERVALVLGRERPALADVLALLAAEKPGSKLLETLAAVAPIYSAEAVASLASLGATGRTLAAASLLVEGHGAVDAQVRARALVGSKGRDEPGTTAAMRELFAVVDLYAAAIGRVLALDDEHTAYVEKPDLDRELRLIEDVGARTRLACARVEPAGTRSPWLRWALRPLVRAVRPCLERLVFERYNVRRSPLLLAPLGEVDETLAGLQAMITFWDDRSIPGPRELPLLEAAAASLADEEPLLAATATVYARHRRLSTRGALSRRAILELVPRSPALLERLVCAAGAAESEAECRWANLAGLAFEDEIRRAVTGALEHDADGTPDLAEDPQVRLALVQRARAFATPRTKAPRLEGDRLWAPLLLGSALDAGALDELSAEVLERAVHAEPGYGVVLALVANDVIAARAALATVPLTSGDDLGRRVAESLVDAHEGRASASQLAELDRELERFRIDWLGQTCWPRRALRLALARARGR